MRAIGWTFGAVAISALACGALVACGGGSANTNVPKGGIAKDANEWPSNNRSMCNWAGQPDLEVQETAGPGAVRPNVRRVFKMVGEGENRHKTLVCREIDTNLDGIKDVVRQFNAKGEATKEEADADYDGKLDNWVTFVNGRISETDEDTNHDGQPDIWKFYVSGDLSRIRRDRNFDGRPDVWEIYDHGHLERMGVDTTFDGHVDRWDRDEQMRIEEEAAQDAGAASTQSTGTGTGFGVATDAGAKK